MTFDSRLSRIRILHLVVFFVLGIMGGFALILLIVGSLATGATRHQIYTGFRSRLGGRIATAFVSYFERGGRHLCTISF